MPDPNRRKLLRRVAAGVALGLAGVAASRLLFADDTPALLRDLPTGADARDRAFSERIAQHFPVGTSEAQVRQQLAAQGFTVRAERRADWQHARYPCRDFAQVEWEVANGRITATRALVWQACT
ncbi:hypothetical protein AB2M62_00070 [Sphingomonas sp. MMS12-HWE2-04]|uniref:hypothetical protein n=1 Tax=Sphingomonas sp. MMS12-HWE2-04 TaxID=3234199 RepID=UPI00384B4265